MLFKVKVDFIQFLVWFHMV